MSTSSAATSATETHSTWKSTDSGIIYNTIRPHQALADRTPKEAYLADTKPANSLTQDTVAEVLEGMALVRAGYAVLAAADMETLTKDELLGVGDELQTLTCQLPTQSQRVLAQLQARPPRGRWGRSRGATCWRSGGGSPPARPAAA